MAGICGVLDYRVVRLTTCKTLTNSLPNLRHITLPPSETSWILTGPPAYRASLWFPVCFLHVKLVFQPLCIQRNQCPWRCLLERHGKMLTRTHETEKEKWKYTARVFCHALNRHLHEGITTCHMRASTSTPSTRVWLQPKGKSRTKRKVDKYGSKTKEKTMFNW